MKFAFRATLLIIICLLSLRGYAEERYRHELFSKLLAKYVDGGLVDYEGFERDSLFSRYLNLLRSTNPDSLESRKEQLAFWINAYNAYTIKLIVDRMPLNSIRDIGLGLPVLFGPWSIEMANVGGRVYTLNEIEHDIIRDRFSDPRIHFALVCASRSCPELRKEAYEGPVLEAQLEEDSRRFVNDITRNSFEPSTRTAFLSRIFDWYASDFEKKAGDVRKFVAAYVTGEEARRLLQDPESDIDYLTYDWSLNGK